ncbi:MAG TPA: phosphoenolpyruvate--protein phosphotransferase [Lachnospiraceae bacterium]|nr:phosphoenolpyruvate--protein phosphotransferase [Lachnospiraceae bacterium]
MEQFKGKSAFQGIAIGKIAEMVKDSKVVRREHVEDAEAEIKRYHEAKDRAITELQGLYDKALKEVGETHAQIFEVHQMMLEDDDYNDSIENIIKSQLVNAEYAVATTGDNFAETFAAMEDDYMRARSADVKDISERVITDLSGGQGTGNVFTEPVILVADDLAPSETVQLDKSKVLAFVTREGSTNSHTAILARTMNIPALVQVPVPKDVEGKMGIVDGFTGTVYIDPDEDTLTKYQMQQDKEKEKKALLAELKGKDTVTKSGRKIKLYGNIGGVGDVGFVLENDAAGIGLFRSEFLYLQSDGYPTEEEQFKAYRTVAEMMAGKEVVIRTLDIGADKQIDYFNLDHEANPALGFRAIRICLDRVDVFKTQLRALYRASAFGNIDIMLPMITSVWEVEKSKEIMKEVRDDLSAHQIPFKDVPVGVMIETPAAVMIADELAELVDFFSIGTNDLTQYTEAIDRQNQKIERYFNPHHPAVLREIQMTIDAGHRHNTWVGICGELGADPTLTETFIKMGIDELSMSPSSILPVRKIIREMD